MDITSLYMFPPTANTGQPYNPAQLQKNWIRPLEPGESATDFWTYPYAVDNGTTVALLTNGMQKGQAATLNMPPGAVVNGVTQAATTQAMERQFRCR